MLGFQPVRYDSGKLDTKLLAASQTVVRGDALAVNSSGYLELATSSTAEVKYVAMQTITSGGSAGEKIQVIQTDGVQFEGYTAGTPAQTDVGEYCDLTDEDTINEAASTNDVFFITDIVNATDKKVLGYFVQKTA